MEKKTEKKCCSINLKYLPIKAHYFFLFGAMGGAIPFMPILAKSLGITATAVGIINTVLPFGIFLSKPIFGFLTDYFRNIKVIMIILVTVTAAAYMADLFVPPIPQFPSNQYRTNGEVVQILCTNHSRDLLIDIRTSHVPCTNDSAQEEMKCLVLSTSCFQEIGTDTVSGLLKKDNGYLHLDSIKRTNSSCQYIFRGTFSRRQNVSCDCFDSVSSNITCKSGISQNDVVVKPSKTVYQTYNFWVFTLLSVIAGTGAATSFCLSDAACYEVIEGNSKLYGHQRLWATISWGIVTFLAGYLNDVASAKSGDKDYSPGFYLMLALILIDLILLSGMDWKKAHISANICKDVGKIFSSCETVTFAIAVYISGALTGLIWNYQFWYLQDLGANQTLLGLTIAVQCLVAEVPFFFFSGWFIRKLGYLNCIICVFAAFALRTGVYSILKNPWLTLPIEVTHGVTFAIFYSAMTSYASVKAPPGTEATMLGVLGGLFEGLGNASGSLLGGVGFDKIGGRQTFLMACIISIVCVPAFTAVQLVIRTLRPDDNNESSQSTEK